MGFAALAKTADFPLLDSYQLVKHYLGLVSTYPERALTLVYLYGSRGTPTGNPSSAPTAPR